MKKAFFFRFLTVCSLLSLMLCLGAFGYFYRASFVRKTVLSDPFSGHGVVFHDRIRATSGYHVMDHYLHANRCSFVDYPEQEDFKFSGSFCTVLKDGSYVSYLPDQLAFWNSDGLLIWEKEIHVHHDVSVNESTQTVFAVSGDFVMRRKNEKAVTRFDAIRGYDFYGREIFYWTMKEHKKELEAALSKPLPRRFRDPFFQYTHFNSVQEIPPNPTAIKIPAFKAGNILVNESHYGIVFIIDRETNDIVWYHLPHEWLNAHSARVNDEGHIVLLANSHAKERGLPSYSSIDFFDPVSEQVVHSVTVNPKENFFTPYWGSVQHIPGGRFLVTNSLSGTAFEIDKTGRILWEWINPQNSNNTAHPVYRVLVVPKRRIEKMLPDWRPF